MEQRVVKDEKLVLAPVVFDRADLDIRLFTDVVVQAIENAKRGAKRAEMTRGALAFAEDGNANGPNEFILFVKLGNVDAPVDVFAVPLKEIHRPLHPFGLAVDQIDKSEFVGAFQQAIDLFLIGGRQIGQLINALIDIGKGENIHQDIDR